MHQHQPTEVILSGDPVAFVVHDEEGRQLQFLAGRETETRAFQAAGDAHRAVGLEFERRLPVTGPADRHDQSATFAREIEVRHHAVRGASAEGLEREDLAHDERVCLRFEITRLGVAAFAPVQHHGGIGREGDLEIGSLQVFVERRLASLGCPKAELPFGGGVVGIGLRFDAETGNGFAQRCRGAFDGVGRDRHGQGQNAEE